MAVRRTSWVQGRGLCLHTFRNSLRGEAHSRVPGGVARRQHSARSTLDPFRSRLTARSQHE